MDELSPQRPGSIVGGFTLIRSLGQGGMGQVFLAHDPKLDRHLAIKVLPPRFSQDPDRLRRLHREARLLASLNHPNIATIYGLIDDPGGPTALVLEFIEGESLDRRLRAGPLPRAETLSICRQITQALEATHERGLLHLDLKPGNVMVTPKGLVKLLDFGLARSEAGPLTEEVTVTLDRTAEEGPFARVSGTPGYMSPEQIRGLPLGKAADIFAFGCILFECIAGKRAFPGSSITEVLLATLEQPPNWAALPADVPEIVRNLLVRCLEADPSQRLEEFTVARVELEKSLAPTAAPGTAEAPSTREEPKHLPIVLTSFVGRQQELRECSQLLLSTRLLTLTGPGGCGKTRLAQRLAQEVAGRFANGVYWVDLSSLHDAARVVQTVAAALDLQEDPARPLLETLAQSLRPRSLLLVLDNCEHLLVPCAQLIGGLFSEAPQLRILATSREHLSIPGEQEFAVGSLQVPETSTRRKPHELVAYDSVRLFLDRAHLVQSTWQPSDEEIVAVAEICRRLDGIPLAIELAAARRRVLAVEQILQRLNQRFRLLVGRAPDGLPRHQTLQATLDWSYGLLEPEEQRFLRALSCFAGGWTLASATAVCAHGQDEFVVLDLTAHLLDKSLILMDRGPLRETRYRFLETIREYAHEKSKERGEAPELQARHLDHFLALAEEASPHFRDRTQAAWLARLEADHENILAALSRPMTAEQDVEKCLRLVGAIWPFWESRGHLRAGLAAADRVLALDRSTEPSLIRARARAAAGCLALGLGDYGVARLRHEEALSICRRLGDQRGIARCLGNLGLVTFDLEDYAAARPLFEECLEIFRALNDQHGIATTLGNLAIVLRNQGDVAGARRLQEENLTLVQTHGDRRGEIIAYQNLAVLSYEERDYDRSARELRESLRLASDLGDVPGMIHALQSVSELLHALERPIPALRLRAAVRARREQMGAQAQPHAQRQEAKMLEELHETLDEGQFAAAWEVGSRMSMEEATALALECLDVERSGIGEDRPKPTEEGRR